MKTDIYISVDIEADGPIPGDYSMSSIGACVVGDPQNSFYCELKPISDKFDPEAAAVSGLDRAKLKIDGIDPTKAMAKFAEWVFFASREGRPVFVAFNATFDWMFVHWYLMHFVGKNPFGISGLDVKAYYMGGLKKQSWTETSKRNFEKRFLSDKKHTHNALDDAREQAEVFEKVRAFILGGTSESH